MFGGAHRSLWLCMLPYLKASPPGEWLRVCSYILFSCSRDGDQPQWSWFGGCAAQTELGFLANDRVSAAWSCSAWPEVERGDVSPRCWRGSRRCRMGGGSAAPQQLPHPGCPGRQRHSCRGVPRMWHRAGNSWKSLPPALAPDWWGMGQSLQEVKQKHCIKALNAICRPCRWCTTPVSSLPDDPPRLCLVSGRKRHFALCPCQGGTFESRAVRWRKMQTCSILRANIR